MVRFDNDMKLNDYIPATTTILRHFLRDPSVLYTTWPSGRYYCRNKYSCLRLIIYRSIGRRRGRWDGVEMNFSKVACTLYEYKFEKWPSSQQIVPLSVCSRCTHSNITVGFYFYYWPQFTTTADTVYWQTAYGRSQEAAVSIEPISVLLLINYRHIRTLK